jgi:hypothetical protein
MSEKSINLQLNMLNTIQPGRSMQIGMPDEDLGGHGSFHRVDLPSDESDQRSGEQRIDTFT